MQESVRIPGYVSKAIILAIALAFVVPTGAMLFVTATAPVETSIVRVQVSGPEDVQALRDAGANVIVDYGNGVVLTRVTKTQAIGLENMGFETDDYAERTMVFTGSSQYVFDSSKGEPQMDANLVHQGYAAGAQGRYFVQFVGPAMSDWEQAVEDQGANVELWVGGNLVLVTMDSNTKAKVKSLPIVEWVGVYHPAYKIASEEANAEGDVFVSAYVYDNADLMKVASDIAEMGISIKQVDASYGYVWLTCDATMLPSIAQIEEVMTILHKGIAYPNDMIAGEVHFFHHAWYTSWSGLDTTLTGTNQILHIQAIDQ